MGDETVYMTEDDIANLVQCTEAAFRSAVSGEHLRTLRNRFRALCETATTLNRELPNEEVTLTLTMDKYIALRVIEENT
jgi:hypothetical protein